MNDEIRQAIEILETLAEHAEDPYAKGCIVGAIALLEES